MIEDTEDVFPDAIQAKHKASQIYFATRNAILREILNNVNTAIERGEGSCEVDLKCLTSDVIHFLESKHYIIDFGNQLDNTANIIWGIE